MRRKSTQGQRRLAILRRRFPISAVPIKSRLPLDHSRHSKVGRQGLLPARRRRQIRPTTKPPPDFAMSALDQAFIKAYAKDQQAPQTAAPAAAAPPIRERPIADA